MFTSGHWAAGILGAVASAGWMLQGFGNAFYYRQVRHVSAVVPPKRLSNFQIWYHHAAAGHSMDKASDTGNRSIAALLTSC